MPSSGITSHLADTQRNLSSSHLLDGQCCRTENPLKVKAKFSAWMLVWVSLEQGTMAFVVYLYAVFAFRELFMKLYHLFEKHWSSPNPSMLLVGKLCFRKGRLGKSHSSVMAKPGLKWRRMVRVEFCLRLKVRTRDSPSEPGRQQSSLDGLPHLSLAH